MGAVSFIETMDCNALSNIEKEEFDSKVEEAIQHLNSSTPSPRDTPPPSATVLTSSPSVTSPAHSGEESARPLTLSTPNVNFDSTRPFVPPSTPNFKFPQPGVIAEDTKKFFQKTGDTIQNLKPFEALGKLFGDERSDRPIGDGNADYEQQQHRHNWINLPGPFAPLGLRENQSQSLRHEEGGLQTPAQGQGNESDQRLGSYAPYVSRRRSPSPSPGDASFDASVTPSRAPPSSRAQAQHSQHPSRTPTPHLDIPTLSNSIASIDAATAQRSNANMDTLMQIFPAAERDVVEMVLEACGGDVGVALERLLEMMGE